MSDKNFTFKMTFPYCLEVVRFFASLPPQGKNYKSSLNSPVGFSFQLLQFQKAGLFTVGAAARPCAQLHYSLTEKRLRKVSVSKHTAQSF